MAGLLRETVDNGLDSAESAGVEPPTISITVEADSITVADDGPGLPWDVVERSINYSHRVTDKAFSVAPTRGRQGNALLTLWAAPYVVDGHEGRVVISSRGETRGLSIMTDPIEQKPVIDLGQATDWGGAGTSIRLHWPDIAEKLTHATDPNGESYDVFLASKDDELSFGMRLAAVMTAAYSLFNSHARFDLITPSMKTPVRLKPRVEGWKKWTVGRDTPRSLVQVRPVAGLGRRPPAG